MAFDGANGVVKSEGSTGRVVPFDTGLGEDGISIRGESACGVSEEIEIDGALGQKARLEALTFGGRTRRRIDDKRVGVFGLGLVGKGTETVYKQYCCHNE